MNDPWCITHDRPATTERLLRVDFDPDLERWVGDGGLIETVLLVCEQC